MIPHLSTVDTGIYRGGQPDDQGWMQLKKLGVTRVIKLNTCEEGYDVAAEALGMEVVYEPITLAEQIIEGPPNTVVVSAVNSITEHSFIHCSHGQDRTGLVVACYRIWKQGWSKEEAKKEMESMGFHWALFGLSFFFVEKA